MRAHWRLVVAFGLFSMTGVQATYFVAVERLNVTVAILLEMTAPMMIVFWLWARTKARPSGLTFFGLAISMIGLVAVLDVGAVIREGSDALDALGVIMGLASAVCLVAASSGVRSSRSLGRKPQKPTQRAPTWRPSGRLVVRSRRANRVPAHEARFRRRWIRRPCC